MLKTLKSQSLRAVLPRILTAAICAVILLALCSPCLVALVAGPSELTTSVESGDYVKFDAMRTVAGFATISGASGETRYTYYLLDLGNDNFAAMVASAKYASTLQPALTQSELYYHNKTLDALSPIGEVSGTAAGMDAELMSYMQQAMDSAGLEGSIVPYVIELGAVGFMSGTGLTVLLIIALAFVIWAAAEVIAVCAGAYTKKALAAAAECCPEQERDADFASAQVFDLVRVGDKLLWFSIGARHYCAKIEDILWGFERIDARMLGSRRYSLLLYLTSGECLDIRTKTEAERKPIANAIAAKGHPFIYGYSQERAGLFARDRAAFIRMAAAGKRK